MKSLSIGDEHFTVGDAVALEIERLSATDPAGALKLARRSDPMLHDRQALRVSMLLMDHSPTSSPVKIERTAAVPEMTKVTIGDATVYIDSRAAREIDTLRGTVAGLTARLEGKVNLSTVAVVADAESIRLAARDAMLADERRRADPSTPRGAYMARTENAWRASASG